LAERIAVDAEDPRLGVILAPYDDHQDDPNVNDTRAKTSTEI
jgi:hypothetical protein